MHGPHQAVLCCTPRFLATAAVQEALGCLRPSLEPKATDFIPQMVDTIQVRLHWR